MNKLKELLKILQIGDVHNLHNCLDIICLHHRRRMALLCPIICGRCVVLGNHKLEILEEAREKRKEEKSEVRNWFDAILFAVIAAILRVFLIEAYTIPTFHGETLVGDFLVSKVLWTKSAQTP